MLSNKSKSVAESKEDSIPKARGGGKTMADFNPENDQNHNNTENSFVIEDESTSMDIDDLPKEIFEGGRICPPNKLVT